MQTLTATGITDHLRRSVAPASWAGIVRQTPPCAPRPRNLYCAWLRTAEGDLGFASSTPFVAPPPERAAFTACAHRLHTAVIDPDHAYTLVPAVIGKPWGAEIWHSGIEARGETHLHDGHHSTPLGAACALFPDRFGQPPRLFKQLRPHFEAIIGDLYFEVHARKHEAYVVTAIDRRAWPDGVGEVRFGLQPGTTLPALQDALHTFEAARAAVDALLPAGLPLDPDSYAAARRQLPAAVIATEQQARAAVDALIGRRPLRHGDVLQVPAGVPHGLRHGVEVAELQTPDYERHILYANQPVASQAGWDVDAGITQLRTPPAAGTGAGTTPVLQRLAAGARVTATGNCSICLVVAGSVRVNALQLAPGASCIGHALTMHASSAAVCVLAEVS